MPAYSTLVGWSCSVVTVSTNAQICTLSRLSAMITNDTGVLHASHIRRLPSLSPGQAVCAALAGDRSISFAIGIRLHACRYPGQDYKSLSDSPSQRQ
ncbi:hypothetical protein CY34DRAFT_800047 [Suillus luteus UH-Slu-Lm8-n1]|uniref:Uncharacterized protein n=1 Tax=Suillus luteus UH-Slu-Lm8-n1 TaxID=930992 RepID=A0A0D0AYC2_9AGAM|nr:hypothetical protein CY34DRAFT_800047 [Suillus luteus UH-Slu-Lm8-n1]